jgi:hypothetical protein
LRWFGDGQQFIIGYVNTVLPALNRVLLDNRYSTGQVLSRTFFLLEAAAILVETDQEAIPLQWPVSVQPFPDMTELAPARIETYLRDFVDAMHAFLRSELDECVRRLITCTETFFSHRGWVASDGPNTFKRILVSNVSTNALPGKTIVENLKFLYKIRNKIVHHGFHISLSGATFCDKSIATVGYLLQFFSGDSTISRYVLNHAMQFLSIKTILGQFQDLDEVEYFERHPRGEPTTIKSSKDLDAFMFTALRFTSRDKSSII